MRDENARVTPLLRDVTTTGAGEAHQLREGDSLRTFQGAVVGTGAVSATIDIECSNDGANWEARMTITLSGTTSDSDGAPLDEPWAYVRGNVTAISGTGATASLNMARA